MGCCKLSTGRLSRAGGGEVFGVDELAGVVGKQPAAVIATVDQALVLQRAESEADSGAPRADEVADLLVRERGSQQDALGGDNAGAAGEMAEDRDDALSHMGQLAYRAVHGEPVLLVSQAGHDCAHQAGPVSRGERETSVKHGQSGVLHDDESPTAFWSCR